MKSQGRPIGRRPRLERYWRSQLPTVEKIAWCAMVPAATLYRAAMALRAGFWRLPRLRRKIAGTRVISVGNLTVGGNAKTPFTLYLARKLVEHGISTAIVSRGYGGRLGSGAAVLVSNGHTVLLSAEEAGDEAVMMARAFDGPVAIARRRSEAIDLLRKLGPLDAVVLDDGFQHLRLARDLDLLLVSAERGFGNGWVLPAGPMREGIGAAARAGAMVILSARPGLEPQFTPAQSARLARIPLMRGLIEARVVVFPETGRWREAPAQSLGGRRILAVSALADPRSFYAMLRDLEADLVGVLEYPDHYQYTASDWQSIWRAAATADLVITTEKDLVKLERFPFPRNSIAALRLEISMGVDEERLLLMALGIERMTQPATAAVKGGALSGA
ncbi:MAG TPA: tetraacyldisaccharide 4'-kinase [Candidatus Binataceae bacterium]|jgi:tetraacyldisaccharide 4'-kinase|nr:tetraacyldisaccharide 4'-kinase [Candidatus Binataceae bacterium]